MSGITPFKTSAPNLGAGTASPLLMGLLGALASLPQRNQERKQSEEQSQMNQAAITKDKLTTQQLQQQIDSGQQTQALSQFQNLYKTAQTMPDWQSSPAIKTQLNKLAKDAGMPANPAYNADGSWNGNFGLQPISSMPVNAQTDAFRNELLAKKPGEERQNYAKSFGVYIPKGDPVLTAAPTFTVKSQNDLQKTLNSGIHYSNMDATSAARATSLGVLQRAQSDLAEGKTSLVTQQAQMYRQIQTAKIADGAKNADAHLMEAQAAATRAQNAGKALGGGNTRLAASMFREGNEAVSRAERAAAGVDAAVEAAQGAGADNSDPTFQALLQKQAQAHGILDTAKSQLSLIGTELNVNTGHAQNITGASGARKVTVTDIGGSGGSKFVNGKVYTDAKGNRATYNNGNWTPAP